MYEDRIRGLTPQNSGALQSPPIELHWKGWRANTHDLQHNGWEFAIQEHQYHSHGGVVFELAYRHPEIGCSGMSRAMMDRDYEDPRIMNSAMYSHHQSRRYPRHMSLDVDMAGTYNVNERRFAEFYPIDMRPDYYTQEEQMVPLYRLPIFRRVQKEGIYLHEASMNEVLKYALDKQAPKQADIRKDILNGKYVATPKSELLLVG